MVVDFIKVEPGTSTKPSSLQGIKKVVSTVRPTPLNRPIQSMANQQQQQQIIVIPGNMLVGSKQNGQTATTTATMEQVKSILKLAATTSHNSNQKTIITTTNSNVSKCITSGVLGANKTPVVLPTLMKATTNAAIVRPVNGTTHKTAIVNPQQQQVQGSPRVISLKRPFSAIATPKQEGVAEPNIIKLSPTSHIQGLSTFTTEHIKTEEDEMDLSGQPPARKRANLDHMSSEEKMMRRKLKNRVAAQNARDKKRVKMDDMEDRIKQLEDQNKRMLEKQQELLAFNQRLLKENAILSGKSYQDLESTSFIKIEPTTFEETELRQDNVLYAPPLSPESLPRSPSPSSSISSSTMTQQQRLSSLDSDDDSTTSLSSIVSSDCSNVSSLVEQRSVEPAVPINVLQQQELHRRLAGEEICKSQDQDSNSLLDPSTTALFWTCLMTTILPVINNLSSSQQTKTKQSSKELLEPLESLILPPKKRLCQLTALKENRLPT